MAKQTSKKTITSSQKYTSKDCEVIKKCINSGVNGLRKEILPRIENIDKRYKDQYESTKRIIVDVDLMMVKRQEHTEKIVGLVEKELKCVSEKQDSVVTSINTSMGSLHKKFDDHIVDENLTFKDIKVTLTDIRDHGTKLARDIDDKLDHINVNGGVFPLNEAFQFIYTQSTETHQKLDEVYALVAPMQARKKWWEASKELIKRNGLLHFVFNTKVGAILGISTLLLIINTILVDVFRVNFDIKSIFTWILNLIKGVTK